jgi:hypothetical protein
MLGSLAAAHLFLVRPMVRIIVAVLIAGIAGSASAKEYELFPEFSTRKVIFHAPPGMPQVFTSPYRELMFRASGPALLPEAKISVSRIYGPKHQSPKYCVREFASMIDEISSITASKAPLKLTPKGALEIKDVPKSKVIEVAASNGSAIGHAPLWCIRSRKHNDYLITELIDGEIQIEITLQAPDEDVLLPMIPALRSFIGSVRIVPR